MNIEIVAYIISIAFQLAGAVMLIMKYWSGSVKKQLDEIQKRRTGVEDEAIHLAGFEPSDKEFVEELCMSRFAFIYITVGYIVGIWGNNSDTNKCYIACIIFIIAVSLVLLGERVSCLKGEKYQ